MANTTDHAHYSPAAGAYAQALLELADGQAEAVGAELAGLGQIIGASGALKIYLEDPAVGEMERAEFLKRVFGGKISPLVMNTLQVMNRKGRSALVGEVIEAYDSLLKQKQGRVDVNVTVAHKLDAKQLEEVGRRVSEALGKHAVVKQTVDESIIGGLVLRVQDRLIDASVKSQLQALGRRLAARA